jgi:hypothetical protein
LQAVCPEKVTPDILAAVADQACAWLEA